MRILTVSISVLLAGICPLTLFSVEVVPPPDSADSSASDSRIELMRERMRQRRLLWKQQNDPVYIFVQPKESSVDAARKQEELYQLQWRNQQERLREGTRSTEEFHRELERSAREIRNRNH
jgi:hypothetical protein